MTLSNKANIYLSFVFLLLATPLSAFNCDMSPQDRADIKNDGANYISPDPSCSDDKPARCQGLQAGPNPFCMKNYQECNASSGCMEPNRSLRCITGECVSHISRCPFNKKTGNSITPWCPKVADSDTSFERCFDGICRPKGACTCVKYSGCKFGKTQCPDGSCSDSLNKCATRGGCDIKWPFSCGAGICVIDPIDCGERLSSAAFPKKTFNFEGNVLKDNEEDMINTAVLRNLMNFKTSAIMRFNYTILYPNDIGPFYDSDLYEKAKTIWGPQTPVEMKADSGNNKKRNRSMMQKRRNQAAQSNTKNANVQSMIP